MMLEFRFQAYYYTTYYEGVVKDAEQIGNELDVFVSKNIYMSEFPLDGITLMFINTEAMKCRVRPGYSAVANDMNPYEYNVWTLFYEIPMPESEFVQVPEKELPTFIGKALLKVLEAQNVPVKIRKHFDRERFISDVRDFFVNVKGCQL